MDKAVGVPRIAAGADPAAHTVRWTTANADASWYSLEKILSRLPPELEPERVLAAARTHYSDLHDVFRQRPVFGKLLQKFHIHGITLSFEEHYLRHVGIITNIAAFFAALAEQCGALKDVRDRALVSLGHTLDALIYLVEPQVRAVAQAVAIAVHACSALNGSRVVLFEFPVGNSIPTRLLKEALDARGFSTTLQTACLSRNDSRGRGITRKALLRQQLQGLTESSHDLYIYCDEWITGSNFYHFSRLLQDLAAEHGARLLPIGLLAHDASLRDRYSTFVKHHSRCVEALRAEHSKVLDPTSLRVTVPEVMTLTETFFWSENDRLAGYRKYQPLGSIVSAIDEAATLLSEDREEFEKALFLALVQLESGGIRILPHELGDPRAHYEDYKSSFDSYKKDVRARLLAASYCTNTDPFADHRSIRPTVADLIDGVAKGTPAYAALVISCAYLANTHAYETPERYPVSVHAPMCRRLAGAEAELHVMLMDRLSRFM